MGVRLIPKDLIICANLHIDRQSKAYTLNDVFWGFYSLDGFPCNMEEFCVFAQLTNGNGKYAFNLTVNKAGETETLRSYPTPEILFPDEKVVKSLNMRIGDLELPEEGIYEFRLFDGDTELGFTQIYAGDGRE